MRGCHFGLGVAYAFLGFCGHGLRDIGVVGNLLGAMAHWVALSLVAESAIRLSA